MDARLVEIKLGKKYNVTFDTNGFGQAPEAEKVVEGKTAVKPEDPTADCHIFDRWYSDKECTTAYDFTTPVTSDIIIYAKWNVNHGTIVEIPVKEVTCTEDGISGHFECSVCGTWFKDAEGTIEVTDHDEYKIPALGHEYDISYTWSEDGKTCSAYAECKHVVCNDKISETVTYVEGSSLSKITAEVKTPAEIGKAGITTYTAKFNNPVFEIQTKDVEDIPALIEDTPIPNPSGSDAITPAPGGSGNVATPTPTVTPTPAASEPKKGDTVKDDDSKASYEVTSTESSNMTVTYISNQTTNITNITVPDEVTIKGKKYKVTEIKANAFKNNKKLKKVTIGKNIRKIGKNAFYGCKNLKSIKIKTTKLTKKTVGKNAFKKIHPKASVKVPKKKLKAYKKMLKARGINGKNQKISK